MAYILQVVSGEASGMQPRLAKEDSLVMVTPALGKVTNATLLHQETIVRRLDDYPELTQALRDGDLPTARMLCARLFDFDARPGEPQPQPVASIIRTG